MAVQSEVKDQGLIGVVVSGNLYRGGEMGYCLVVTRDSIMGAKKPRLLGDFGAYLGPGGNVADATRSEANSIANELTKFRDFTVPIGLISRIIFKKPGLFFGGYVKISTRQRSFRIDMRLLSVGGEGLLEASDMLSESLRVAIGEDVHDTGSEPPMTRNWSSVMSYDPKGQDRVMGSLGREEHLRAMLAMLEKHRDGLSNAEIDAALSNYSQWTTFRHLRELMTMGLIEYKPELFGNPGKYFITDLGVSIIQKLSGRPRLHAALPSLD